MTILYFFGSFLASRIRIRIRNLNADPDPDPTTQINADPCGSGSGYGSGSETLLPSLTVSTASFPWSWPIRNKDCVWPHWYCFIPALACGEGRKARIRLLAQSCQWNDKSVNREPESTTRIGSDASFFARISKSTINFEFRTISVSVSPLIFLQR